MAKVAAWLLEAAMAAAWIVVVVAESIESVEMAVSTGMTAVVVVRPLVVLPLVVRP